MGSRILKETLEFTGHLRQRRAMCGGTGARGEHTEAPGVALVTKRKLPGRLDRTEARCAMISKPLTLHIPVGLWPAGDTSYFL